MRQQKGITLVEIIIYLFIMAVILVSVSGFLISTVNSKKQLKASDAINYNARFITNYLTNRIHNVVYFDGLGPDPESILFYTTTTSRFNISLESNNLVYRQTEDIGSGFPEQSLAVPVILNSQGVRVASFSLMPVEDYKCAANRGVSITFTLETGTSTAIYNYLQKDFRTFISLR